MNFFIAGLRERWYHVVLFVFLLLIAFAFYWLNSLVPPVWDDVKFAHRIIVREDGSIGPCMLPINSFSDLAETLNNLRYWHNARLANFLFICLHQLGGLPLISCVNAVAFACGVAYMTKLSFGKLSLSGMCLVVCTLGLFLPVMERTMLWRTAAVAYVGGTALLSFYVWALQKEWTNAPSSRWRTAGMALLSLACGCFHEGLALPLFAGVALFAVVGRFRKRAMRYGRVLLYLVCMAAGILWLFAAPGLYTRVGIAASNGFVATLAASTLMFVYRCPLALLLCLIVLWRERRQLCDRFDTYLLVPNIGVALLCGVSGKWGGAYYFAALCICLFVLRSYGPLLQTRRFSLGAAVVMVLGYWGIYNHVAGFRSIYDDIVAAPAENGVVVYDYFGEDAQYDWFLTYSLPLPTDSHHRAYLADRLKREPFEAVINQFVRDKSVYNAFTGSPQDVPVYRRFPGLSVVRLPLGQKPEPTPPHNKAFFFDGSSCRIMERRTANYEFSWLFRLASQKMLFSSTSYHAGFFYVVISDELPDVKYIEMTMKDAETSEERVVHVSPNPVD